MYFVMMEGPYIAGKTYVMRAFCAAETYAEAHKRILRDDPFWRGPEIRRVIAKPYIGKPFLRFDMQ